MLSVSWLSERPRGRMCTTLLAKMFCLEEVHASPGNQVRLEDLGEISGVARVRCEPTIREQCGRLPQRTRCSPFPSALYTRPPSPASRAARAVPVRDGCVRLAGGVVVACGVPGAQGVACANGATRTSLRRGSSAWSNGPTRVTLSVLMSSVPPSVFAMSCIRLVLPLPGAPFRRLGEVHAMSGQPEASSSPQSPPGSSCSQSISRDVSNSTGTDGLQTTNGSSPPASRSRSAFFAFWLQRCVCWKQPGVSKTSCAYSA